MFRFYLATYLKYGIEDFVDPKVLSYRGSYVLTVAK